MAGMELDLESISNDPEALARAFNQIESGETLTTNDPEPPQKTETTPAQEDRQQAKQDQQADGEQGNPSGVATKDGKHVIPYSVLKGERDRASRAEQVAKEMQERIASLEAQAALVSQEAKPGDSARTEPQTPAVGDLSPEDLEVLQEDFPTVYKAVMASIKAAKMIEAKLQPVEESMHRNQADQARTAAEAVQDAIDSVPKLAHIQANDAQAFTMARQFDAMLREQPAWADKTLADRFAKVAEMVEAALGPIDMPGAKPNSPSAAELRTAAKAKADAVLRASKGDVPTSLSEFPAGQHAAQDEREEVENLSALQLAEKFSSMTPDQMDAYFRTLS